MPEMPPAAVPLPLSDTGNKFEDLSGVTIKPGENPYDALINACDGSAVSFPFPVAGCEEKGEGRGGGRRRMRKRTRIKGFRGFRGGDGKSGAEERKSCGFRSSREVLRPGARSAGKRLAA